MKSYAEAVSTSRVLTPVIGTLGLDTTVEELAEQVSAEAPLNTVILSVSVTDPSPSLAAAIANAIGETLPQIVTEIEKPDAEGSSPVKISTLQPAQVPEDPDSPNLKLNLALGGLVGLALGLGVAVLIEVLDTRIRGTRDIEQLSDASVIGGIAYDADAPKHPLVVQADPLGARAEAFRSLRTNIQFVTLETRKSFVFTSALPGEGKTTTSSNLAITLAEAGERVVYVDADLRKPEVAKYLNIGGGVGLTDVLVGRVELEDAVQEWGEGNLYVLPAGKVPPNPSELLGSQTMSNLVRQLEDSFDVVIFDCSPVLPVTDAAILSRLAGGVIVLVAAGRTHKNQFVGALEALEHVGANLLGVVVNMLPTKGVDAGNYGQYSYSYGGYYGEGKRHGGLASGGDA